MSGSPGGIADYFAMAGYGVFIWPSYALAAVLLAGLFLMAARRLKAAERERDSETESRPDDGA